MDENSAIPPGGHDSNIWLPSVVVKNAQDCPNGLYARTPLGPSYTDGYRDVSNLQYAQAIDHIAHLIESRLGKGVNFETVAYIGPSDIRYNIVIVAGIKAGYKVFLPSPRNSLEAHLSLLERLDCKKMILTEPALPCVADILRARPLETFNAPSVPDLLDLDAVPEYPVERGAYEHRTDPIFVLHTSGSTGIPKPLIYTNEFWARVMNECKLVAPPEYKDVTSYFKTGKFLMTLPGFHIGGLAFLLYISSYFGSIPVYTLTGPPPTTESFLQAVENTDVDWAFVPPVVIDEIGKHEDLLDRLSARVKYLFFTGGAVPKQSGDAVAKKVAIWQVLGSSETASFPLIHGTAGYSNAEDWQYVQFHPEIPLDLRHQHEDLHELVVKRLPEKEAITPVWTTFPDLKEYSTRDLLKPHPTKQGLWIYHSRNDDIIVFLNGEKTNPTSFEEEVISHPEVKAALVVGAQRLEAALLVELATNDVLNHDQQQAIIDSIWPLVQKANSVTPAHARVSKSKILLVDPRKPMLRAGKGTVQRNATVKDYAKEIDELYEKEDTITDFVQTTSGSQQDDVRSLLRNVVAELLHWDDLDLFQLGMDSLGALRMQKALKKYLPGLNLNTIYSNPSINALLRATDVGEKANGARNNDPTADLSELLAHYFKEISSIESKKDSKNSSTPSTPAAILLTGSTGALGSYILHHLLSMPTNKIARIYCFNRTKDAHERQVKNCESRNLTTDFPSERVVFISGDLSKPLFGLDQLAFADLMANVTHIVHNAWPVNFNLSLRSFVQSVEGVLGLIKFAAHSTISPSIQFCSSVSSVSRYPGPVVPEVVINELETSEFMGYGQSKYLCERMLNHASHSLGIQSSSARIGQVAGAASSDGRWNRQEWLPSLVVSSHFIGALPETLGSVPKPGFIELVNWVPMDQLAQVLVELSLGTAESNPSEAGTTVHHITHPKPIEWSSLFPAVKKALPGPELKVVPYADWVSQLKTKTAEAEKDSTLDTATLAHQNPAVKLLEFFESLQDQSETNGVRTQLGLEKTLECSQTLREMEPIREEWMHAWVQNWL